MSRIELTRSVCDAFDDMLLCPLALEPVAELPVAVLPVVELPVPLAELPVIELDPFLSAQWPFTSTLCPSCFWRFLPSSRMFSLPVVPLVALLELLAFADELDEPEPMDTSVSMYCALLVLFDALLPVVPVALLPVAVLPVALLPAAWLDGSRQPVTVTVLEFDFCERF